MLKVQDTEPYGDALGGSRVALPTEFVFSIETMIARLGEVGFAWEVLGEFLEDIFETGLLGKLRDALSGDEPQYVAAVQHVHELKGVVGNLGIATLVETCVAVQLTAAMLAPAGCEVHRTPEQLGVPPDKRSLAALRRALDIYHACLVRRVALLRDYHKAALAQGAAQAAAPIAAPSS